MVELIEEEGALLVGTQSAEANQVPALDSFRGSETGHAAEALAAVISTPTSFVTSSEEVVKVCKNAAKALFNKCVSVCEEGAKTEKGTALPAFALPELHVDGFDSEQIWLQIDMNLDMALKRCKRSMKKALMVNDIVDKEELPLDFLNGWNAEVEGDDSKQQKEQREKSSAEITGGSQLSDSDSGEEGSDSGHLSVDDAEPEEATVEHVPPGVKGKQQETDALKPGEDDFLRFSDMDKFLQEAEEADARSDGSADEDDEDAEDGTSEEGSEPENLEDEEGSGSEMMSEEGEGLEHSAAAARYRDLFLDVENEQPSGAQDAAGPSASGKGSLADESFLSSFERQQRRLRQKIQEMEDEALQEKPWEMQGEISASKRPLNSALEADLDYDTGVRGAPEVSEETAQSVEEMIKKRCIEGRFDDVIRIAPPPPEKKKAVIELDDKKSSEGLGALYEKEYVRAAAGGGAVHDRDEPTREEARQLFGELSAKLDALSHFFFAPKPVVEELSIKTDVPALAMEEALPTAASAATLKAPEEAYSSKTRGDLRADEELDPSERKAARAKRKRKAKRKRAETEAARRSTAAAAGGAAPTKGLKSDAEMRASSKPRKAVKGQRSDYVKSTRMFSELQSQQEAAKAGLKPGKAAAAEAPHPSAAALKL